VTRAQRSRSSGGRLPVEAFFDGRPPWFVLVVGIVFVVATAVIDYVTGPGAFLAPLYLMPILLVTWNVGRRWGLAVAGLATVATQVAGISSEQSNGLTPSWNAVMWFLVMLFVVWMQATLKTLISSQRIRIADQEVESEDLREMNEVKDVLLHAVSHDLKGPLAGILGAMQTIRRGEEIGLTPAETEDLYEVIEQAGTKANRLVEDLLDLDRLKRGQLKPERRPTDIGALVRGAVRECTTLGSHPVSVEADDALIAIDPAKAERIVENLVANAGRHTPPGTPISVRVQTSDAGVEITIEDHGPGVPDAAKERIFEPFEQVDPSHGGVGIGLSLVRRFAELHGGGAWVEDTEGGGARFVVELPGEVAGKPTSHAAEQHQPELRAV
jgi:signal transduction histidine kinase